MEKFVAPFVTNIVFQNICLYWIIHSNKNLSFDFQHHFPSWVTNGPYYITMICPQFYGSSFEDYVTTSRRDWYNIMFSIEGNERYHKSINYYSSSGGGIPPPYNSTKYALISFDITLDFIAILIKSFKTNSLCWRTMYCE